MTNDQIEAAARELCRMRGIDPDAREADRWGMTHSASTMKCWETAQGEVERFAQVGTAIAAAMERETAAKMEQAAQRIRSMLIEDPSKTHYDPLLPTEAPPRVPRKRKTSLPTREDLEAGMRKHANWMDDVQGGKAK